MRRTGWTVGLWWLTACAGVDQGDGLSGFGSGETGTAESEDGAQASGTADDSDDGSHSGSADGSTSGASQGSGQDASASDDSGDADASATTGASGSDDGASMSSSDSDAESSDGESGTSARCQAVDVLFVIDNSDSMEDREAQLTASFAAIELGLAGLADSIGDLHVGVVTTDDNDENPDPCDDYGALVTSVDGFDGEDDMDCGPYAEGFNFMTAADDFGAAFSQCAARVGTDGGTHERPLRAIERAISEDFNAQGACNESFFRPDALLAVVMILDEDDDSDGTAQEWFDAVVARKPGGSSDVVVLTLGIPLDSAYPECAEAAEEYQDDWETRHLDFTQMFDHHLIGDICEPSYVPFFQAGFALIEQACGEAVPG